MSVTGSAALAGVPAANAARIDVLVTHPAAATLQLTGYKTRL